MSTATAARQSRPAVNTPSPFDSDHEQVIYCRDEPSGLQAIIAIHSTALGPALGGTRCYPYDDEGEALADVLRLSRGMTYKNALAGLDLGGAKSVIIGDPTEVKSEALLRAFGRFVDTLGGRYIAACDVGTVVGDMDLIHRETPHVAGLSEPMGGVGDPSVLTSLGLLQAMRACARHVWGSDSTAGRRIGISGIGKVGWRLTERLLEDGAHVMVTDINTEAIAALRQAHPEVEVADSTAELMAADIDVFAPCALGGVLDAETVATLHAQVVCGSANNQLATAEVADQLRQRGITYAPDYLVNSGGAIGVADELGSLDKDRARHKVEGLYDTTLQVLRYAEQQGISPARAGDEVAEHRIAAVGSKRPYLPVQR